jgi:hypothetical protein
MIGFGLAILTALAVTTLPQWFFAPEWGYMPSTICVVVIVSMLLTLALGAF